MSAHPEDARLASRGRRDVTLYTRPGCHLCDEAKSAIAPLLHEFGATLRVKFPESNATCRLEIKSPAGALLKTIKAETSNGVMNIFWDLTADNGKRCTNDAFDTVFHIALPDSGKIQTLKGP